MIYEICESMVSYISQAKAQYISFTLRFRVRVENQFLWHSSRSKVHDKGLLDFQKATSKVALCFEAPAIMK